MAQKFTVKKGLTKRLGLDGWVIYRDSLYGLYAENEELGIDHCLNIWNLTLDDNRLDFLMTIIRLELETVEKVEREFRSSVDPNMRIVVQA